MARSAILTKEYLKLMKKCNKDNCTDLFQVKRSDSFVTVINFKDQLEALPLALKIPLSLSLVLTEIISFSKSS